MRSRPVVLMLSLILSAVQSSAAGRDGTVLWHRFLENPIYMSTGISGPSGLVFTGSYLNPPQWAEATPLAGDGTAAWTYSGTTVFVDASRNGVVLAAVDFNDADSTAVIREWRPDSALPLWSYLVHPCRSLGYEGWASRKPIQVSDDGSTIAAALVMYTPGGQVGRLFVFDAGSGTPAVDWPFPQGNVVATAISVHGEVIAMAGWPTLYVYDRNAHALRWSGAIGAGNDALALSGDGQYVAWGWTTFNLRHWNGSTYQPFWSHTPGGGIYVGQCALDSDGSALAVTWDTGNSFPNQFYLDLYALPSLDLLWTYDYQNSRLTAPATPALGPEFRDPVDVASQMLFSPDGRRLAVASWGGEFPELHVFDRSGPTPLFTLDTPGSLFDVDIVDGEDGASYVSACGKHVHAGQAGRGADLYAIEIPGTGTSVEETENSPKAFGLSANHPNPFNPTTTLEYRLAADGPLRMTIHDAGGRLVRRLVEGSNQAGSHAVVWDGRNDAGALLASGVYIVRLEAAGRIDSRKILLAK